MKALIIDTSHDTSYIILLKNKEMLFFKKLEKNQLSKNLLLSLEKILQETQTKFSDLQFIATSIGPGSFTGLRISASICKTINFTHKIPLIGYCSLKAYTPINDGPFICALDARSNSLYAIEGEKKEDTITYLSKPYLALTEDIIKKNTIIISPDACSLKKQYKNNFEESLFNPYRLIELCHALFVNKKFEDFLKLNLLYLKGPNPY